MMKNTTKVHSQFCASVRGLLESVQPPCNCYPEVKAMATPRHNPFCARPGCGKTALMHAYPESSCEKYIAKGSKEARELETTRAIRTVACPSCKAIGREPCSADCAGVTKVGTGEPIDSGVIDNRLVCATNEWLQAKIAKATLHLQVGLSMPKDHPSRDKQFDRALKALGGLGSS